MSVGNNRKEKVSLTDVETSAGDRTQDIQEGRAGLGREYVGMEISHMAEAKEGYLIM